MSWSTAKGRFERDVAKLPSVLANRLSAEMTKKFALPTFDTEEPLPILPKAKRITAIEAGITSGDSVYIHSGEKKGTILTVYIYNEKTDGLVVSDINEKRLIPKLQWPKGQSTHLMDYPRFIPRDTVRLAGKEKDANGKINYVVADKVVFGEKYYDDRYKMWIPRRFVKHHPTIEIPWPNPPAKFEDGELLTLEPTVMEKTYELQTVGKLPIPAAALGQLRNPYLQYKKRTLTECQVRRMNGITMPLTIEQKIYLAKQATKPVKPIVPLLEEAKDLIGAKMAEHLNSITSPFMRAHLDALSKSTIPDFAKTMEKLQNQATLGSSLVQDQSQ